MYLHPSFSVFISYPDEDAWFRVHIQNLLTLMEITPYVAEHKKEAGRELRDKFQNLIDRSDCVLVLYTQYAPESKWVNNEIQIAKTLGKRLVSIKERNIELPDALKGEDIEHIPFNRNDPIKALIEIGFHMLTRRDNTPHAYFLSPGGDRHNPNGAQQRLVLIPKTGKAHYMGPNTDQLVREGKIKFSHFIISDLFNYLFSVQIWANILGFELVTQEPTLSELRELGF